MITFAFGPYRLSPHSRILERNGVTVPVGSRALDILIMLTSHAGELVPIRELVASVWRGVIVSPGTVRVQINTLRKALGDDPARTRYVSTVSGLGYRFVAPIDLVPAPGESLVPALQVQMLERRVVELQQLLGEKTRQYESLKRALCIN